MKRLAYTLIGDGSSDEALMNIVQWLINDIFPDLDTKGQFADFRHYRNPPSKGDINGQIVWAHKYYPFDILIYHRDAERNTAHIIDQRKQEILGGISSLSIKDKTVCLVPVVMMESWLLFDELAIKKAAENKYYSSPLALPPIHKVESLPDPKKYLQELLKTVSCKKKRNLKQFNTNRAIQLIAENIQDFSPLRSLQSFQVFEQDIKTSILQIIQ